MPIPSETTKESDDLILTLSQSLTDSEILKDGEEFSKSQDVPCKLSRAQQMILDHKQFKAARTIQSLCRGWLVRLQIRNSERSAVIIQKWWRRFLAQRRLLPIAEERIQSILMAHYNRSATLIQTLFRGFWSRKHVFDLTRLKTMQRMLAEDLIHSVVKILRTTKSEGLLPGVYSARYSDKCLENSEKLLVTFGYRFYNAQACYKSLLTTSKISDQRKAFKRSVNYTTVPYFGFNDTGICDPKTSVPFMKSRDGDLFHLIQTFMAGHRKMELGKTGRRENMLAYLTEEADKIKIKSLNQSKTRFVNYLIHSIEMWHDENGQSILPKQLFKKPVNMNILLNEVKATLEDLFGQLEPCVCGPMEPITSSTDI
ncbi:hypothetical protein KR009_004727 [Drosophila setifemur]|nr:hypothetical protein KR009_004727 [Drosophila setifemur]